MHAAAACFWAVPWKLVCSMRRGTVRCGAPAGRQGRALQDRALWLVTRGPKDGGTYDLERFRRRGSGVSWRRRSLRACVCAAGAQMLGGNLQRRLEGEPLAPFARPPAVPRSIRCTASRTRESAATGRRASQPGTVSSIRPESPRPPARRPHRPAYVPSPFACVHRRCTARSRCAALRGGRSQGGAHREALTGPSRGRRSQGGAHRAGAVSATCGGTAQPGRAERHAAAGPSTSEASASAPPHMSPHAEASPNTLHDAAASR
jgi:hypothetical protein